MTKLDYTKLKQTVGGSYVFWQRVRIKKYGTIKLLEVELLDCNLVPDCRIVSQGFRNLKNRHSKKAMRYRTIEGMKDDVEKLLASYGWAILEWK